ncbi:MAG: PepSY-associated TM helix domain-containing protein [Pseudomonas marincola]|uniref:PepSY-associated TM helix domain-containing protein n=1 Tax=Pseudomonas marincola TaxID=437900 RepID=UPI00300364BF
MKPSSLTQSMSWLHTWGGLIFGWLLFAIFLTGTLAVFDKEIDVWMQPEAPVSHVDQAQAAEHAISYLQRHHGAESAWDISLPTARSPLLSVSTGERRRNAPRQYLDPNTGEPIDIRETAGGRFFFLFHFTLHMPRNIGIWLVGLAAIGMLVALFSSLIIHKKFFKEFFTFRPNKGQRSWLDAHNATGVLVLPFHLMITYTGLVIFSLIYMPAAVDALFDGDREAAFGRGQPAKTEQQAAQGARNGRSQSEGRGEGSGELVALTPLQPLLLQAEQALGEVRSVSISHPGRSDARIEMRPVLGNRIELSKGLSMTFAGVSGEVLKMPEQSRWAQLTQRVLSGLHFAQFGGYPMRWLYFFCGMASCAMIATGLVLFTVKRRRRPEAEGPIAARLYHLAERLNISVIAGLSIACVAYLWGNRLLPAELSQRGDWEVRVFFACWALSLLHAYCRERTQAWREQLICAAVLCVCMPLLSLATMTQPWAEPIRAYLELSTVACGALFAFAAWRIGQKKPAPTPRRQSRNVSQELLNAD